MPHLVAATDFSSRSHRALRRAGRVARQADAELTIVHVVEDDQPQAMIDLERREAERYLGEQIATLAELRGLRCRPVVTTGEASDGVLRTAADNAADLIVMGSHRKQLFRDIFVGTTIERVVRSGPTPVLMVNTSADHAYRKVIAAVDLSEPSAHAVAAARRLTLFDGAAVTVLHAFLPAAKAQMTLADAARADIDAYVAGERHRAEGALAVFLTQRSLSGDGWQHSVEEGNAVDVIARTATADATDLVVVGTHGRTPVVKALIGSVAEAVLRSLDVDILAVPPPR